MHSTLNLRKVRLPTLPVQPTIQFNKTANTITVRAPASTDPDHPSHNTDACDVTGKHVLIENCDISTGDDNFTCGGGTSDILISNNVYGSGHAERLVFEVGSRAFRNPFQALVEGKLGAPAA